MSPLLERFTFPLDRQSYEDSVMYLIGKKSVGKKFRRQKFSSVKNIRHHGKNSSLFTDGFFTGNVLFLLDLTISCIICIKFQFFIHTFQEVEGAVRDAIGQTFFFEYMVSVCELALLSYCCIRLENGSRYKYSSVKIFVGKEYSVATIYTQ